MLTKDFDYELPKELIAQEPVEPRDRSRLMVVDRRSGTLEHRIFEEIITYFKPGDVLVVNNTKVMPARLYGTKADTGARIEILLLRPAGPGQYEALVKPGKKVKLGTTIVFGHGELVATVVDYTPHGGRILDLEYSGVLEEVLEKLGTMPLPPYITHQLDDPSRYQTVYGRHWGSAAAPTAGLHFTESLLTRIKEQGIEIVQLLLHVGLGTFRPVEAEKIEDHKMHSEFFRLEAEAAERINQAKVHGGRIIAVGTTSVRVLETAAENSGKVRAQEGWTDIFIYPGYRFKTVDALITNFHLPQSTLLMLVSAFAGSELTQRAYAEAIASRYRFFSFGDAMFIF
ncbi:MAG: tRNA preQ1(34) S-adenosylmethionine ribosyltransferase-isomerase QueA [Clostridia bacterium]|jgi:S-adenosylmethionine:tRNA ribosyltransferase-isomerase|nr:tRNA preQ1(34) S-adenosylmethionine ribosyltransferase-isomerase QueA [Clostridia bacterium]